MATFKERSLFYGIFFMEWKSIFTIGFVSLLKQFRPNESSKVEAFVLLLCWKRFRKKFRFLNDSLTQKIQIVILRFFWHSTHQSWLYWFPAISGALGTKSHCLSEKELNEFFPIFYEHLTRTLATFLSFHQWLHFAVLYDGFFTIFKLPNCHFVIPAFLNTC